MLTSDNMLHSTCFSAAFKTAQNIGTINIIGILQLHYCSNALLHWLKYVT